MLAPCTKAGVAVPVPPRATGKVPVVPASIGKPVALVKVPDCGVPSIGVTSVGDVANTAAPEPVPSVNAPAKLAEVNEPSEVALPVEVIAPVRLALVVTLPAVRPAAVPVMFVPTSADGVPRAGVTKVGEVANTRAPEPVSLVTAAARFALDGVPRNVATPAPRDVIPVPPLATGRVPVTPVVRGRPVVLVNTPEAGVPSAGVTSVGDVANTNAPLPVSFVTAAARLADDGVAKNVATPVPRPLTPVDIGSPVALVKTPLEGVPRAGVTSVGLVANTRAPEPVSFVTAAAKFALDGVPRNVATPAPREVIPVPPLATGSVPVTPEARFTVGVASVTAAPAPAPSVTIITFWPVGTVTVAPEP